MLFRSRIYMAYHFDGPERRDKLQSLPKEFSGSNELSLPAFFRIDQTPVPQPPETIPESAWMLRLGEQLQGSTLLSDAIESALTSLKIALTRGLQSAQDWLEESNRRLREAHRLLAQACLDFSLDPNAPPHAPKIRLQASREVIEQIAQ